MSSRWRLGFTLLELLSAIGVTAVLVLLLGQMVAASLRTIGGTTKMMEAYDGTSLALELLRDDLAGVSPIDKAGAFLLQASEGHFLLAVARADPRLDGAVEHGLIRHVVYEWSSASGDLFRAEYHSARDEETIRRTSSTPFNDAHGANLQRIASITPLFGADSSFAWVEAAPLLDARERARATPILRHVEAITADCYARWPGPSQPDWQDPNSLPELLKLTLRLRPDTRGGKGGSFELLVPMVSVR